MVMIPGPGSHQVQKFCHPLPVQIFHLSQLTFFKPTETRDREQRLIACGV